ncbi:protein cueball isoform X2 [Cephus cinctus]|nr:protein cueball isoform X2 [Cephus cinctus]
MFLSDTRNKNVSIYSNDLTVKNFKPKSLLKTDNITYIVGMVFDPISRTLFWTDAKVQTIMKMHIPLNGDLGEPEKLHDLKYSIPGGIALDICNRFLYWTNSNRTNPTIERSLVDGSNRTVVISRNLYEPMDIAVDHETGKLYWADDVEGISFHIERSNSDGTERELLVNNRHQRPTYLTVDHDRIYWSDTVSRTIWMIKKDKKSVETFEKFKSYESRVDADPAGIITRDNIDQINCQAISALQKNTARKITQETVARSYNNLTTSTEEMDSTTERSEGSCLNNSTYNPLSRSCICKSGFNGSLCETSVCYNYCLHGTLCTINKLGVAQCECGSSYSGSRCEKDLCDGYCLNDGVCTIENGAPSCKCKNTRGPRCENTNDFYEICTLFCKSNPPALKNYDTSLCNCTRSNQTDTIISQEYKMERNLLLPILGTLIGVLIILVITLSIYVNKLRRRPRIKKRFVVSKTGVTPLTSRPQMASDQCEITIENCCNMNICETPCFEPKLRSAPTKSVNTKKEEKNSLLDSMEGDSC